MSDITVNASGTTQIYSVNTPSPLNDTSLTIAAGNDRYLIVGLGSRNGSLSGLAITWNGVALTQLNIQQEPTWLNTAYIFGLAAPATGNQTLTVSWTGGSSERITFRALCLNNVSAVSGTLTNGNGNSANSQGNIATAIGDATVSVNTNSGSVAAVSHTQLWADSNLSTAQYNLSTGSLDAHQYTHASTQWAIAGIRLLQTGVGGGVAPSPGIVGKRLRGFIYS